MNEEWLSHSAVATTDIARYRIVRWDGYGLASAAAPSERLAGVAQADARQGFGLTVLAFGKSFVYSGAALAVGEDFTTDAQGRAVPTKGGRGLGYMLDAASVADMLVRAVVNVSAVGLGTWDDLRFPASGINPAGLAAPPVVDDTTYPGTLLFSNTVTNAIAGAAQMPHAWEEGSTLYPHIHWTKTTSGDTEDVAWEFAYAKAGVGAALPAYSAWEGHTLVVGSLTAMETHFLSTFPVIDMTGELISSMVFWQLQRNVSADAYGAAARLLELDFHYQLDANGSRERYMK